MLIAIFYKGNRIEYRTVKEWGVQQVVTPLKNTLIL